MVQPQYGQQGVPVQPQYGAVPPGPASGMPPPEIKWSGLETGGAFHLPVTAFIGRLTDMVEDAGSTYGLRIVEKFDQVQILVSPVPWPWATIDPSIKYSAKENSNWGKHIASAKALGLAVNAATLAEAKAELVGKVFEMHQESESYGENSSTGETMKGDVWKFVRIVGAGQGQALPQPQYAQTPQVAQPAAPPVQTPVVQTPVAVPVQSVSGAVPGAFDATLNPTDTAPVRAKKLLHNRALNEWLSVALIDDVIKGDPSFVNSIYDQSFIVGLKGQNQVVLGADNKFQVVV